MAELGREREYQTADKQVDVLKLKFQASDDLQRGDLRELRLYLVLKSACNV
mgnify:CR=1 FL=1